jgi:hypothetical protein
MFLELPKGSFHPGLHLSGIHFSRPRRKGALETWGSTPRNRARGISPRANSTMKLIAHLRLRDYIRGQPLWALTPEGLVLDEPRFFDHGRTRTQRYVPHGVRNNGFRPCSLRGTYGAVRSSTERVPHGS